MHLADLMTMTPDRDKWNRKYRDKSFPSLPSAIVRKHYHQAKIGRALDLACGNGRNACFLAACGFQVDAVDISEEGLGRFVCRSPMISRICQDLDTFVIPPETYDLIINTRFLERCLFPALQQGLRPGGVLIFESYLRPPDPGNHQFSRNHLLEAGELQHAFPALQTICYQEGDSRRSDAPPGKASLVTMRPRDP